MPTLSSLTLGRQAAGGESGSDRFAGVSSCAQKTGSTDASWMRFMIKADDERFKEVVAHFT
jgi:hypothetical protein